MKKGTLVKVKGYINTRYFRNGKSYRNGMVLFLENQQVVHRPPEKPGRGTPKFMIRYDCDFEGIVVGKSVRQIGYGSPSSYDEMGFLDVTKRIPVIMVVPVSTDAYIKPYATLEEDLELI